MKHRNAWRRFALLMIGVVLCCCGARAQDEPKTPEDRLLRAVMRDENAQVTALLRAGVSPNAPNSSGIPPLVWAAQWGRDTALIQLLLDHGANIEGTDVPGNTPLLAAAAGETYDAGVEARIAEITLLLDRGASLKATDKQGDTALRRAMQHGHHLIVRLLLDHGADLSAAGAGPQGFTPLHVAAFANDTDLVKRLLNSGADVNRISYLGTPLIMAAEGGSLPTLQALLAAGADVNVRLDHFGGFSDALLGTTALLCALENGNVEAAQLLIAHGADVNVPVTLNGRIQYTPLTLAFRMRDMPPGQHQATFAETDARHAQIDALIGQLLERGANVNVVANTCETPLVQAIQRERSSRGNHVDWVKPLLDRGAEAKTRIEYIGSALHVAVQWRPDDLALAGLLLDHGAEINAAIGPEDDTEIHDLTPLLAAITRQHFAMAKFLLQRGATAECSDRAHKTPLLWAAYDGQLDLVKLLLAHGANLNAKDVMGQTAVMLAQKGGHPDIAAFLKSRGGSVLSPEAVHTNALHHAVVTLPLKLLPGEGEAGPVNFALREAVTPPALIISRNGRQIAQPITFSELLTSTALWTPEELNDIHYQVGRSYYSPDAYQFFGLVTAGSGTYLGLFWYSPAASAENMVGDFVFGLRVAGNRLELEVVAKSNGNYHQASRYSDVPKLKKSEQGDLIRIDWNGRHRYLPSGQWDRIGVPP